MDFALITDPGKPFEEIETLIQLLDQGLPKLHIRKPHWSPLQVKNLLKEIPRAYYSNISLHGDLEMSVSLGLGGCHFKGYQNPKQSPLRTSKSFHRTDELLAPENKVLDYGFLSPVFKSISKENYPSSFVLQDLQSWMSENKTKLGFSLYALGGILPENLNTVKAIGFDGIAVLGAIWKEVKASDRLAKFKEFQKQNQNAE